MVIAAGCQAHDWDDAGKSSIAWDDKLARDARGVEFMEGTGNIQKLNLFTGLVQGHLRRD